MTEPLPPAPPRPPDVEDLFTRGPDPELWVDHYLPHWTTPDRSAARWTTVADGLQLRIEADQPDWRPEDAPLRVSNLQTGCFCGGPGSTRGTHRHRPDGLVVRTPVPTTVLWAPTSGRVDVTVSAGTGRDTMLAAWLVGTEQLDERDAGEICLFEIDAAALGPTTVARTGLKAHGDDRLTTDMADVVLPFDASTPHTWTVIWGDGETVLGCEGRVLRRLPQSPDYPLFLLVDLFEIGPPAGEFPKTAVVHAVRGWAGRSENATARDEQRAMTSPVAQQVDVDVEYHLAGAMVGHRLAGGEPNEVDLDLARRVATGELTVEDAIEIIKRDMGIPTD